MKKYQNALLGIILVISLLLSGTTPVMATTTDNEQIDWPKGPSVFAEAAIVMEASTGLVLYSKNMNDQHYPASITKILTVLLALEHSSLGEVVTFSENAVYDVEADSSRIWVDVGEQMTMQQCLYAILLDSANDVSYGVAEHIAGSIENFAKMMNEKAKSLGCKNSNFVNPHGLPDKNHYTSAYDMALITREAMKNETFAKIFGTRTYQLPPTNKQVETRYWNNHHKFILKDTYHYDDCIGGKTGFTNAARYTLSSVAKRGDLELICIIMKDQVGGNQYIDTQKLFDFGFDNYSIYPIADLEDTSALSESPLFTRYNSLLSKTKSPITTDDNGFLVLPNTASFKDAQKEVIFFPSDTDAPNDELSSELDTKIIGKISYTYDGKYVGGADILYNQEEIQPLIPVQNSDSPLPIVSQPGTIPEETNIEEEGGSLRPIIIGVIVGLIVVTVGVYYVFIERPRLKRRNAYYKKRALRKLYKDDDFINL